MIRILLALFLLASPAHASEHASEKVIAGLSQNRVAITANFDGTGILIFGAVKREAPPPTTEPLDVIIAVSGPERPVVVRKKARVLGIWVNKESRTVSSAPSFYAIASTGPLPKILSKSEDLRYKITIPRMVAEKAAADGLSNIDEFASAVIRIRQHNGLYTEKGGKVNLADQTLFDTQIALPSALVEGDYKARVFLLRDGRVIDDFSKTIAVRKVGLERWIYNLAHERPLIYGLLSLTIAILAGWLASTIFRLLKLS